MARFATTAAALVLLWTIPLHAQLKSDQESASQSMFRPAPSISSFLGLLNPENFSMRHNVSFSYLSYDGMGMSLASYTNSMAYKNADPLNVRLDLTLQGSPFGQNALMASGPSSRLFVSRAELNYRPWDNTSIRFQYSQLPIGYYGSYNPYTTSPFLWGE